MAGALGSPSLLVMALEVLVVGHAGTCCTAHGLACVSYAARSFARARGWRCAGPMLHVRAALMLGDLRSMYFAHQNTVS